MFYQRQIPTAYELNVRYLWKRAENHVLNQLRGGCHPHFIERAAHEGYERGDRDSQMYFTFVVRIMQNLKRMGVFYGLPTYDEYRALQQRILATARFEFMMRNRFADGDALRRAAMDDEITRRLAASRALDREAEQDLQVMREKEWKETEAKYHANEYALRSEMADLRPKERSREELNFGMKPGNSGAAFNSYSSDFDPPPYKSRDGGGMPPAYYSTFASAGTDSRDERFEIYSSMRNYRSSHTSRHTAKDVDNESRGRSEDLIPSRTSSKFKPRESNGLVRRREADSRGYERGPSGSTNVREEVQSQRRQPKVDEGEIFSMTNIMSGLLSSQGSKVESTSSGGRDREAVYHHHRHRDANYRGKRHENRSPLPSTRRREEATKVNRAQEHRTSRSIDYSCEDSDSTLRGPTAKRSLKVYTPSSDEYGSTYASTPSSWSDQDETPRKNGRKITPREAKELRYAREARDARDARDARKSREARHAREERQAVEARADSRAHVHFR